MGKHQDWADIRCLRLKVIGYTSSLYSVRELWQVTQSRTVVILSTIVGSIAGTAMAIALRTANDPTYLLQLLFCVAPLLVNVLTISVVSGIIYLRLRGHDADSARAPIVTITVTPIMFLAAMVPITILNVLKVLLGGLAVEWLPFVLLASPFAYILVSDFLIYVIYKYISPSLLEREHLYPPDEATTQDDANTDATSALQSRKDNQGWANQRCLSIWIAGHRTSLMSISELWTVVFSRTVMALSILIGSAAGAASAITLRAIGDPTYYILLFFSVAPVFVNIQSAAMMSAVVYFRLRGRDPATEPPIVVVPSTVTIFIAALPTISGIYILKLVFGGLGAEWFVFVLVAVPIVYDVISDFFHFIVFRYITPSIWGRPHIYPAVQPSAEARMEIMLKPAPAPQPAAEAQPAPAAEAPDPSMVEIGELRLRREDVLLLESQANYLRVVTPTAEFLERFRISEAADLIGESFGVFLHRSRWVAYAGIEHVEHVSGQYRVKMLNEEVLSIAATRQQDVLEAFAENRVSIFRPPKHVQNG